MFISFLRWTYILCFTTIVKLPWNNRMKILTLTFDLSVYRDAVYSSTTLLFPHMIWPTREMSSTHYDISLLPRALHLGVNRINMDLIFPQSPPWQIRAPLWWDWTHDWWFGMCSQSCQRPEEGWKLSVFWLLSQNVLSRCTLCAAHLWVQFLLLPPPILVQGPEYIDRVHCFAMQILFVLWSTKFCLCI